MDLPKLIADAGFDAASIRLDSAPMLVSVPPSSADPATDRIVRGMFGYGIMAASR